LWNEPKTGGEGDFAASHFISVPGFPYLIDSSPGEDQGAKLRMTNNKAQMSNQIPMSESK